MVLYSLLPPDIFMQKEPHSAILSDTPWESLTCFHRDRNREIEQCARGIYGNRPKYDWNLSLCFMLTDSNNCSTPLPSCWGLVAASVWRSKTWLKHKPSHLPSPCPAPPRPRLLLNQLFWFTPLSVCQNEPNVFLFPPAAKQPGGFRVLQRIAVLIQTLGFAESAGPGAALLCISVPWQS